MNIYLSTSYVLGMLLSGFHSFNLHKEPKLDTLSFPFYRYEN